MTTPAPRRPPEPFLMRDARDVDALNVWQAAHVLRVLVGHAAAAHAQGRHADLGSALAAAFAQVEHHARVTRRETLTERIQRWADEWI